MGVVEQQLGEKPPRTSTCSLEENPRPAVPHIQASRAGPEILNNSYCHFVMLLLQLLFMKE